MALFEIIISHTILLFVHQQTLKKPEKSTNFNNVDRSYFLMERIIHHTVKMSLLA